MQNLDVISVNIWLILISLCNLLLLFLILKKFLYKPVKKVMRERQESLDKSYSDAENAKSSALAEKEAWERKMQEAKEDAKAIIKDASSNADKRSGLIISDAKDRADEIIKQAEIEAELEKKKAAESIKREIAEVSANLTEKLLGRDVREDEHRALIDSFISEMGENDGGDK